MNARYVALPASGPLARALPPLGVVAFVLVWWIITASGVVNRAFIPTPGETLGALLDMFRDGIDRRGNSAFWDSSAISDGWASIARVAKAVFWASLVGIPIGIVMGAFGRVEAFLRWVIFPLKTAPIIAFIPVFMTIWGVDERMKVGFLFFGTVVYMIPLTFDAIRGVPEEYVDAAVDFGFTPVGTLWHFLIPAAWPRIFEAIKVCTGIAWTYLVAAEIVNVTTGLGRVIFDARRFQNAPRVWAGILLILAIGVLTDQALGAVRRRFFNWEA
jgi:NitT/TauT family transport system permease protein